MAMSSGSDSMINTLRDTIVSMVRRDGPDLSARQLAVFLTCYLQDDAHTVRGLAAELNVSKPAITRALDRLQDLDLAWRTRDPMDGRSVLIRRTLKGKAYLRDLSAIVNEATAPREEEAAAPVRKVRGRRMEERLRRAG
ncbi:MarR family winged helix-turn-helix transcriptional regulator [Novacetimonas cocois]|uniref:MarR family transcriptional regulator n=1 Tax=Novacetimonas cocois TaxID=1747507 RepID=A0A365Z009_9PROT|nr:MarR family winged helix-turn-helix transcriptional regulator [Novacetimonas cocois]RBM09230.1 MarR family transcriptional regulator [Novacetimonas cocois]